ncbi:hypothetical protein EDC04DRAFT_2599358 [Pisolithus marmoratus]|nr:hypothetical protein EDC04DRAFT_2599358 [Pisolithus marmoratus]
MDTAPDFHDKVLLSLEDLIKADPHCVQCNNGLTCIPLNQVLDVAYKLLQKHANLELLVEHQQNCLLDLKLGVDIYSSFLFIIYKIAVLRSLLVSFWNPRDLMMLAPRHFKDVCQKISEVNEIQGQPVGDKVHPQLCYDTVADTWSQHVIAARVESIQHMMKSVDETLRDHEGQLSALDDTQRRVAEEFSNLEMFQDISLKDIQASLANLEANLASYRHDLRQQLRDKNIISTLAGQATENKHMGLFSQALEGIHSLSQGFMMLLDHTQDIGIIQTALHDMQESMESVKKSLEQISRDGSSEVSQSWAHAHFLSWKNCSVVPMASQSLHQGCLMMVKWQALRTYCNIQLVLTVLHQAAMTREACCQHPVGDLVNNFPVLDPLQQTVGSSVVHLYSCFSCGISGLHWLFLGFQRKSAENSGGDGLAPLDLLLHPVPFIMLHELSKDPVPLGYITLKKMTTAAVAKMWANFLVGAPWWQKLCSHHALLHINWPGEESFQWQVESYHVYWEVPPVATAEGPNYPNYILLLQFHLSATRPPCDSAIPFPLNSMIQCTLHLHKEQALHSGSPSAHCTCTKTFFLCNEQSMACKGIRHYVPYNLHSHGHNQTLLDLSNLPSTPRTPVCLCNTVGTHVAVPPPCIHAVEGNPLADAEAVGFRVKLRFIRDCTELMKAMSGEQKKILQSLEADEVVSQERLSLYSVVIVSNMQVIFEQGSLAYVEHCTDIAMDIMLDEMMNKFRFSIIDND